MNLYLRVEQCIRGSGRMEIGMVMEFKFGQMERSMKDIGGIIKHMEKESFGILMGMYLMESGKMIKLMVMEYIRMLMEQNMKENGKMIYKVEEELKCGQMDLNMKECIKMDRNTD
jgi:hypothetical protein